MFCHCHLHLLLKLLEFDTIGLVLFREDVVCNWHMLLENRVVRQREQHLHDAFVIFDLLKDLTECIGLGVLERLP